MGARHTKDGSLLPGKAGSNPWRLRPGGAAFTTVPRTR